MKNAFIAIGLSVICVVCGFVAVRSIHSASDSKSAVSPTPVGLPSSYADIQAGMTEGEVIKALGRPLQRSVNPRFENRSEKEWAEIQTEAQAAGAERDASAAPSVQLLRLGAELNHRVKDSLRYKANSSVYVTFTFDGSDRLLQRWTIPVTTPSALHS